MERLHSKDGAFVTADGKPQSFWGVNAVSAFFEPETARATAGNLHAIGVDLVRHHHLLRHSADWCYGPCKALALYREDSRTPDAEAWKRFDLLNAALAEKGIRISLSAHFSRGYRPGDVAIQSGPDDGEWQEAIRELNSWDWRRSHDPLKLLPVIDSRSLLLQKEFTKQLLTHCNPYTGRTYGADPQVLYIEMLNESSLEYALICGNRFPAYFETRLQQKWEAFCAKRGQTGCGSYCKPETKPLEKLRSQFLRELEDAYYADLRQFIHEIAPELPVVAGNLWRGNDALCAVARVSDLTEDHFYPNPLVASEPGSWVDSLSYSRVAGKPFVIGELGVSENPSVAKANGYARPMLLLSAAAYGAYHGVDAVLWFAWNHGDRSIARDGWAKAEGRLPAPGNLLADGLLLDHMATCSRLFHALRPAKTSTSVSVQTPVQASNYNVLMQTNLPKFRGGSLTCLSYEKTFSASGQTEAPFFTPPEDGIYRTDTGEITRNLTNGTLVVEAPSAEAYAGPIAGERDLTRHCRTTATNGFATVILVSRDEVPIAQSHRLLISRSCTFPDGSEAALPLRLTGLSPAQPGLRRYLRVIRPRAAVETLQGLFGTCDIPLGENTAAEVVLPDGVWTQAEIVLKP